MIPASSGASAMIAFIGGFLLLLPALFGYLAWTARHAAFEVSSSGLFIRGGLYGRTIAAADLDAPRARATDLTIDSNLAPSARTNEVGLPGYAAGWFQLNDGERALAFLTDRRRVAYLPTRSGYAVLVSVADPQALVRAVRQSAGL